MRGACVGVGIVNGEMLRLNEATKQRDFMIIRGLEIIIIYGRRRPDIRAARCADEMTSHRVLRNC